MAKENVGQFVGSKWTGRYWQGGCTCGSGKEGRELHDGRGIYCGITCSSCKREDTYRKVVMNTHYNENDVDEQIEAEYY
jgi:hypothetical protein